MQLEVWLESRSPLMVSSPKFTLDPILRWPSKKAKIWLREFMVAAEADPNISSVVAIGSSVREGVASADLDLVVLVQKRVTQAFGAPPIDIDLRTFKVVDVVTLVQEGNDLLGWTIKFGQPLLDKNNVWNSLVQTLYSDVPLPSAEIALERAKKTDKLLGLLVAVGDTDASYEQLSTLLTHIARARLANHGIFPTSRPELAKQLREVNENKLAILLEKALNHEAPPGGLYAQLKNFPELKVFARISLSPESL